MTEKDIEMTKVWQVNHTLVVADTISEAVEIHMAYYKGTIEEDVFTVSNVSHIVSNDSKFALIKKK